MPQPLSEEQILIWKQRILEQRASGLPMTTWCRQNNISRYPFRYWRKKLFPEQEFNLSAFREIVDHNTPPPDPQSGISVEFKGLLLHLNPNFDPSLLKEILLLLKEVLC